MGTRRVFGLFVLLLTYNSAVLFAQAPFAGVPAAKAPETSFDFGTVLQGNKVAHEFEIGNEGEADLLIQRISASCGCTASTVSSRTIPPGKSEKLRVEFDTAGFSGNKTKSVEVVTNDPRRQSLVFSLKGVVEPGVVVEPARIQFGEITSSSSVEERQRQFTVRSGTNSGVVISSVKSNSRFVSVAAQGGGSYKIELSPELPKGEFRDRVVVEVEGGKVQSVNVPITASVRRDLRLVPGTVSFGVIQGSASIERQVSLENATKKPVTFNLLAPKDPAITASLVEVQAGRRALLIVSVDPSKVQGDLKTSIEIETSHPTEPRLSLNVFGVQAPK